VLPTLELIREMAEFARRDPAVIVTEITSANRFGAAGLVERRIVQHIRKAKGGQLLFVTHEAFLRVVSWPAAAAAWDLLVDEALEVVLSRAPFRLPYSSAVLTSFLQVRSLAATAAERAHKTATPEFTEDDGKRLEKFEAFLRPEANASEGEKAQARRHVERLLEKRAAADLFRDIDDGVSTYYQVESGPAGDPVKARRRLNHRVREQWADDVFAYIDPIPRWLAQGCYLFTAHHRLER
jgi:hypothetical protein